MLLSVLKINFLLSFEVLVLIASIYLMSHISRNQLGKWYRYGGIAIIVFMLGIMTCTTVAGVHHSCSMNGNCGGGECKMKMISGHCGMGGMKGCSMMMGGHGMGMCGMNKGMDCCKGGMQIDCCKGMSGHCEMEKEESCCGKKMEGCKMEDKDDDDMEEHMEKEVIIKKDTIIKKK